MYPDENENPSHADETVSAQSAASSVTAVSIAVTAKNASDIVDTWAADLIGNLADLRETENYNAFRAAIADLKTRIQP